MAQGRSRLVALDPSFRPWAEWFIGELESMGIQVTVTSGRRSPQAQASLIARGLSTASRSNHLTGFAFDMNILGRTWRQTPPEWWEWVGGAWEGLGPGFRWGGRFRSYDPVHFDYSGR